METTVKSLVAKAGSQHKAMLARSCSFQLENKLARVLKPTLTVKGALSVAFKAAEKYAKQHPETEALLTSLLGAERQEIKDGITALRRCGGTELAPPYQLQTLGASVDVTPVLLKEVVKDVLTSEAINLPEALKVVDALQTLAEYLAEPLMVNTVVYD